MKILGASAWPNPKLVWWLAALQLSALLLLNYAWIPISRMSMYTRIPGGHYGCRIINFKRMVLKLEDSLLCQAFIKPQILLLKMYQSQPYSIVSVSKNPKHVSKKYRKNLVSLRYRSKYFSGISVSNGYRSINFQISKVSPKYQSKFFRVIWKVSNINRSQIFVSLSSTLSH